MYLVINKAKIFLSIFFLIWITFIVSAQEMGTVFYDFDYNRVGKDSAYYYRKAVFNGYELPTGDVTDFYMSGKVYMKGKYLNGKRIGNFTWWHENGEMKEMGVYKKGEYIIDNTWDEDGNALIIGGSGHYADNYENRKVRSDGDYNRGKKTGIWIFWYPNGKKKEKYSYTNDDEKLITAWKSNGEIMLENGNGKFSEEFSNGIIKSIGHFKDGKKEGVWKWYYPEGLLKSEINYANGKKEGNASFFFKSGDIKSTEIYRNGLRNGECIYYNASGGKEVDRYRNDTLVFAQLRFNEGDELYGRIDSMPYCKSDLNKFFNENLRYPSSELSTGWTGLVHVGFTVNKVGRIQDVKVELEATQAFNDESLRVIKLLPEWQPGVYQGKPVNVRMMIPLKFYLYTAR